MIKPSDNRQAFARATLAHQDKIANKHRKALGAELRRAVKELADDYPLHRESKWQAIIADHKKRMQPLLSAMAKESARKFINVPFQGVKPPKKFIAANALNYSMLRLRKSMAKAAGTYVPVDSEWDDEPTWLSDQIVNDIGADAETDADGISLTTLGQAQKVVARGVANGSTQSEISRDIVQSLGGLTSRARAATIARTEVHSAANRAQHEMATRMGMKVQREWIATNDDRVRDAHEEADGQTVAADEPFDVGDEQLMYPGDPSGSPENTINCRCCIGYDVLDDEEDDAADDTVDTSVDEGDDNVA